MKKTSLKKLLIFQVELSSPKPEKLLFLFGEALRVFYHCFSSFFIVDCICLCHQLSLPCLLFCCSTSSVKWIWKSFFYFQPFFTFHSYPTFAIVSRVLRILESFFYSQAFFTLHSFPTFGTTYFYQGFPGSRQFFLKSSRVSHWGSKHRLDPSACLNHTMFSKGISR